MLTRKRTRPVYRVIAQHGFAEIREDEESLAKALFATCSFEPGDIICRFSGAAILNEPTYLTVQVGETEHIHLQPEFLQYINHSCNPNVIFNTTLYQLECLQPIKTGDELCFFYPATEWSMAQPFECLCGSKKCLKYIQGAAHLPIESLEGYKLTDFIQRMLNKTIA